MSESPVMLQFDKVVPADLASGRVTAEHYFIVEKATQQTVGTIRFRLSNEDDIRLYAGHIGYGVDVAHRGKHYATHACLELRPIAIQHGFTEVWITCNPENSASRKTCERIGAELVELIDLPGDSDMCLNKGERQKCRYRWQLV